MLFSKIVVATTELYRMAQSVHPFDLLARQDLDLNPDRDLTLKFRIIDNNTYACDISLDFEIERTQLQYTLDFPKKEELSCGTTGRYDAHCIM